MAKGGVTLDTVMINIESDAGKATSNIDNLAKSLETLKSSIKGGFNNLNKLASSLEKLKSTSAGLKDISKNMSGISKITAALQGLDKISNPNNHRCIYRTRNIKLRRSCICNRSSCKYVRRTRFKIIFKRCC